MGKDTGEVEGNSGKLPIYMEFKPAENTRDWAGVVQNILPMRAYMKSYLSVSSRLSSPAVN